MFREANKKIQKYIDKRDDSYSQVINCKSCLNKSEMFIPDTFMIYYICKIGNFECNWDGLCIYHHKFKKQLEEYKLNDGSCTEFISGRK